MVGYKIKYTKISCLPTGTQKKLRKSFTVKPKYLPSPLRVNLTKEVNNLYKENYRILLKQIEDTKKEKDTLCPRIGRISIVRMVGITKATFNAILPKFQQCCSKSPRRRS